MDTDFMDDTGHQISVEFEPRGTLPSRLFKRVLNTLK